MDKKLTKNQKEIEVTRQLKNYINKKLIPYLNEKAKKIINDKKIPDEWMMNDNYMITKYVIDDFCLSRPFEPYDEKTADEFSQISKKNFTLQHLKKCNPCVTPVTPKGYTFFNVKIL